MKGSRFALAAAASVAIVGCGGSGGAPFSPITSVPNTPGIASYATPVAIQNPESCLIADVAPNGKMLGDGGSQNHVVYWATPTSAPVALDQGTFISCEAWSINNAGQIVGSGLTAGLVRVPLYWSSPSAAPTQLTIPGGQTTARAFGINAAGQIVGDTNTGANGLAVYWATPSSTPAILPGVGGGSNLNQLAIKIADTGRIYGFNLTSPLVWTSPSANANQLEVPSNAHIPYNAGLTCAMNHETGEAATPFVINNVPQALTWPLSGFSSQALPSPAGYTLDTESASIGPNHVIVGLTNQNNATAVAWPSPTTPFVDLNTKIPSNSGWHLAGALFMDDAREIVGIGIQNGEDIYFVMSPTSG